MEVIALLLLFAVASAVHTDMQSQMGMMKRRESDHRVTIDLSALRPSLPGLVLYRYGDLAPKLVQVDLSSLNPRLQPHVVWPQFGEMGLEDRQMDMDEAIPYLTDEDSLMSPKHRMSKMDDFDHLMALQGTLPLADEVIVPLDWEERRTKKDPFTFKGWRAGIERGGRRPNKGMDAKLNGYYTRAFGGFSSAYSPKPLPRREMEGDASRPKEFLRPREGAKEQVRVSSQESWSIPRQYWNVPHLFVNNWQRRSAI